MKKIYLLIILIISFVGVASAQTTHDKISYQSVVRTGDNHLVYDTWVTVAVSIANDDAPSVVKYSEKHTVLSNANGLISFLIGDGVDQHGNWNAVKWNRAEITLVTSVNGNVLSTHTYPLSAVPYALYAKIADTASYADSVDLDVVQNFLNEHGYLPEEPQVLSISNDTIYLTRGGWVKLPEGFSGDYNDLTNKPDLKPVATSGDYNDLVNKPTKSDLCDSVKDCVTGWISDSTRMVFDTLHDHYATKNALRDTAEAIRGALVDTAGNIRGALVDTAFDIRGALVDTAAAIRADMGDAAHDAKITIQKNGVTVGDFTLNQATPDTIDITVPTTVAELTDAGNYVTNANLNEALSAYTTTDQIDTLLGDYAKKETLKNYLTISGLCDSVMNCNGIKAMKTDIQTVQTDIQTVQGDIQTLNTRITNDSTDLADKMHSDSLALAGKINSDSLTLAQRMDTVYKHLCDSVMECSGIKAMKTDIQTVQTDIQTVQGDIQTLNTRITNDSTDLADKMYSDSLALAEKINSDSLTLAHRMDTVYKHLCDSVMECSGIKAIQTDITHLQAADDNLSERITNDSTDLAEKISSDSLALAEKINSDSLALAHRMDTVYKHLCDSVMECSGIKAIQTDITHLQAADDNLSERITNDSTKLKNNYYTKTQVDSVGNTVRSEIGKGKLTIQYGSNPTTTVEFGANQDTLTTVSIPTSPAPAYGTLTIKRNNEQAGAFTANQDATINIDVPTKISDLTNDSRFADTTANNHFTGKNTFSDTNYVEKRGFSFDAPKTTTSNCQVMVNACDLLAVFDSLAKRIDTLSKRFDSLKKTNDSLFEEIDKLKPSLTLSVSSESVKVCRGYTTPVTYTATFHNCSSSDYTILWKVNNVDSTNVKTPTFTFNAPDSEGDYEVVCVATRAGNPTVTDTITTAVTVDENVPSFTADVDHLTVNLSNITKTAKIQWDTDSLEVDFTGTDASKTYSVADTVTITATSERGCTLSKQAILQPVKPAVTTVSVPTETITATSAIVNGTVTSDGGIPSTKRGMVYSTSNSNLKLGANGVDSVMNNGTGKGNFACTPKRLIPCTQYHVCAFAINDVDTVYGDSVIVFTTPSFNCGDSLVDIDDNKYATLLLGSQCWMKQNLRTTRYADGTEIPLNPTVSPSYSPYRYVPRTAENVNVYGYLYNWAAAMGGSESSASNPSGVQGACPDGWHLPSDAEWTQLTDYVISDGANLCDNNLEYIIKSMASKERWCMSTSESGCSVCSNPSTNNNTGFSVLPAGVWNNGSGDFDTYLQYQVGISIFYTATKHEDPNTIWIRLFDSDYPEVRKDAYKDFNGFSVRCVLDCSTGHTYMPTVSAVKITNTGGTINLAANVDSDGGATVTERGVCWSKTQHPTADSAHTTSGSGIGAFSVPSTLTPDVTYYVRAYAINSVDTAYGAEVQLVIPIPPTVTTAAVTDITTFAATSGGEVTVGGSATVTARGVCWSTSPNPTVGADGCDTTLNGGGTGSFISHITGLKADKTYYLRAYATNGGGTSYGSQVSFTTPDTLPEVTTSAVSNITVTTGETPVITVVCGGEVTSMGVDAVTARGVCWSSDPTIEVDLWDTTLNGSGLGSFTSNITGLSSGPTYYLRAYATNSEGTAYGDQVSFTIPVVDDKSCPEAPTVIDHEGNVYATVQIGDYCWMRENLRTTTSPKTGTYLVNESGYCSSEAGIFTYTFMGSKVAHYPNNNSTDVAKYGMLYNWCAVVDTANPTNYVEVYSESTGGNKNYFEFSHSEPHRGICPVGWHVPNNQDWNNLTSAFSQSAGKLAGGNDWKNSTNPTAPGNYNYYPDRNISGFTALPAGKFNNCSSDYVTRRAYFWGSVQMYHSDPPYAPSVASCTYLDHEQNAPNVNRSEDISQGLSVRCVRNSGHAAEVFVTTDAVSDIAQTSVMLNGSISGPSNFVAQKGFEWKLTSSDSYNNPKVYVTDPTLSHNLTDLTHNTSYTFRAFIKTDDNTTIYGYEKRFITRADHFIVETEPVTDISQTSATLHGSIANPDPATIPILVRGFEWKETDSTSSYQAIVDDDTQDYNLTLSYDLTVLKPNRSYAVRAFATVDTGTVYGNYEFFNTPSLTLSANPSDDTLSICAGSQTSITYTAAFANVNSSDYTISWKVNGTDSSAATNHLQLTVNVGAKGAYKVVCVATREGYSTLTDTITTYLNTKAPTFTVTTDLLIVNLSNIENTSTIQWDMDSDPVPVSGTSATHDYTSKGAGTYTITATGPDGCTATRCVTVYGKRYCSNVTPRSNEHANSSNSIDILYDYEGHSYAVVQIGSQCWMAQNLRTIGYYNEATDTYDTIPEDSSYVYSSSDPYIHNQNNRDVSVYGYLYNWAAATGKATIQAGDEYANPRGVCPEGWHLPSSSDYEAMLFAIDEEADPDAGKLAGPTPETWIASPNQGAPGDLCYEERNSSGFSALRSGYYEAYSNSYYPYGSFYWTSYKANGYLSAFFCLFNDDPSCRLLVDYRYYNDICMSVRCVRN